MKWFWLLIAGLVVLAAVFTLVPTRQSSPPPAAPQSTGTQSTPPAAPSSAALSSASSQTPPAESPAPSISTAPAVPQASTPQPAASLATTPSPSSTPSPEESASEKTAPAPAPAQPQSPTPKPALSPAEQQAAEAAKARAISEALDMALSGEAESIPKSASAAAPASPAAASASPADPAAPAKLEPQADGSVLVDGKYTIKGQGTKDAPYRVTWEQLVSAELTYQPRLGRKVIPDRLKMLDGKWVTIAGYVAFPIMAQSQDEMLVMLNQWDGCCIGVPPTPYDAIEVKLKAAAKGDQRLRVTGEVTGILRVDPYLVKDWLVSLYLMDDAALK